MENEKILLTIAARGGSKGVKDKNIRMLNGKPLIAYTVLQAIRWGKAHKIVCSTDAEAIASLAKEYGAEVPFRRPANLAGDATGKLDVIRHALQEVEAQTNEKYSIVVDLDVTAPIRTVEDIDNAVKLFKEKRPKTVFSVVPCRRNPYFNVVEINQAGYATLTKKLDRVIKSRQEAPRVYDMNASIYVYDRDYLLDPSAKSALSDQTLVYVMDEISTFDIDAEADFDFIEYLVTKGRVKL